MRSFISRRVLLALTVIAVVGIPALALRLACVGRACDRPASNDSTAPFCGLSADLRERISKGFYDGRSPDVFAIPSRASVFGATDLEGPKMSWPSLEFDSRAAVVPLVFHGSGVEAGAAIPSGPGLEDVAPTVAEIIGLNRPHPTVRSGQAIPGVAGGGKPPRLVLEIVLRGVSAETLEGQRASMPHMRSLIEQGAVTWEAEIPSLPLDPAAVATTLGTGGLPSEHGMMGTYVRNEQGEVVRAWGPDSPFSVIATLGDHLDELRGQEPRIGVVGGTASDLGLIGGNWYLAGDRDDVVLDATDAEAAKEAALQGLEAGYGADEAPDLLAVVLDGSLKEMDDAVGELFDAARRVSGGRALTVITSMGSSQPPHDALSWRHVEARVERDIGKRMVEATALGGMFVDQDVLARSGMTEDPLLDALRRLRGPDTSPLMADVFSGIAVTFGEFC